jgi:tetratricopeptide (TPR) repeat protein
VRILLLAALVIAVSPCFGQSLAKTEINTPRIAELNARLARSPNDVSILEERAHAFALLGQRERALADLRRVVELKPNDVVMLRHVGWTVFNVHEFKLAFGFWQRSGDLCNYDSSYSNYTMALGYWGIRDLPRAAHYYDRAVTMEKEFGAWDTLQERTSYWTDLEKHAIYQVFDAWRRGYKAGGND